MCGGTGCPADCHSSARGLSPRVRGNRADAVGAADAGRSIPACAGEPKQPETGKRPLAVYPRVCGGTSGDFANRSIGVGLSPRVRGNLVAG